MNGLLADAVLLEIIIYVIRIEPTNFNKRRRILWLNQ
jgi:hypothetical protein